MLGDLKVGTYLKRLKSQFSASRNTSTKRNEQNTMLFVILTYIWMIFKYVEETSAMGVV
jgi:hypothetical protein